MPKEMIFFSDVEFGSGTITDDFVSDKLFISVINDLAKKKDPVDLIFNGDTFDFLKVPVYVKGKEKYPTHITDEIALEKLDSIYKAHKDSFLALKAFLNDEKNEVYFVIGNHDYELLFDRVQEKLKSYLGEKRVHILPVYTKDKVYAEHGHQYHVYNKYVYERVFRSYKGKKELNIPMLFSGMLEFVINFKIKHPFIERIIERQQVFSLVKFRAKLSLYWLFFRFYVLNVFNSFFQHLIRGYGWVFFETGYSFLQDLIRKDFDICDFNIYLNALKRLDPKYKVVIFGHRHDYSGIETNDKIFIVLNSWRDEYGISEKHHIIPKTKNYARVVENNGQYKVEIVNFDLNDFRINLKESIEDELSALKKANEIMSKKDLKDYTQSVVKI